MLTLFLCAVFLLQVKAFGPSVQLRSIRIETVLSAERERVNQDDSQHMQRRKFIQAFTTVGTLIISADESFAAGSKRLPDILPKIKEARSQLDAVPSLIKEEKWDSVRAILITPPLSDCWSKTSKLLNSYAEAIGDEVPDGDEFAALELKEEALDHLRFLDMAVYNNVFNPIKTEGETGATKELIRSYYEDPVNEYKSCVRAFDGLIDLSSPK